MSCGNYFEPCKQKSNFKVFNVSCLPDIEHASANVIYKIRYDESYRYFIKDFFTKDYTELSENQYREE